MADTSKVKGLEDMSSRIKAKIADHRKKLQEGLSRGGALILQLSAKEVPVDTGNLKRSGFVEKGMQGTTPIVHVGYKAAYAIFVHENLDAAHGTAFNEKHSDAIADGTMRPRGPDEKAKFLEDPIRENLSQIKQEIASPFAEK